MTEVRPMKIGVVGTGNISATYVANLGTFDFVAVKSVHSTNTQSAWDLAQKFGLESVALDAMLSDPEIELVINLTPPVAHYPISRRALLAGKHVYSEKPLGVSMEEARDLMEIAQAGDLRLGCAPDTILGGGHQLTRRLYDEGKIGNAIAATAILMLPGHENWHPNPHFFYGRGGGPMLDVGPYYVTALVALLGPVREVFGAAKITRIERQVKTGQRCGETISVLSPTHITGVMEFHSGATVTIITSFDVVKHKHTPIEIYGNRGSMLVPDPNDFTGKVEIFAEGAREWEEVAVDHPFVAGVPGYHGLRGLGAAEMVDAIRAGRPHRTSAELAFHVLEVMTAFEQSAQSKKAVAIHSTCGRPAPVPRNSANGMFG